MRFFRKNNSPFGLMMLLLLSVSPVLSEGTNFNQLGALAKSRYGHDAYKTVQAMMRLVKTHQHKSERDKLRAANHFFNKRLQYQTDIMLWHENDYWATPLESIGRGAADCEDFSIAKYALLKMLGIDNNKLRLTYVRAKLNNKGRISLQAHMVLSYFSSPDSEPLILDNLIPTVEYASDRPDLYPVFSFNDQSLWVGANRTPKPNSQQHLSKWRNVLTRMRQDGIE